MNHKLASWIAVAVFAQSASALRAGNDWPQWRGPHFNGSSDAVNLPGTIEKEKAAWTTQLPGLGSGTPVIVGDRIFVSCVNPNSAKLLGNCISLADGHTLWSKEIGTGAAKNERNNTASPSAVTDGKIVYFYFATGDLAAFDVEGKPLWQRDIQKDRGVFNVQWIYSSSPLLYKGKLYVQVLHRDVPPHGPKTATGSAPSYLLALDPKTGKDLWSVERPNDAVSESKESYATPTPFVHGGKDEIVLVGGDCVTCHDAETGKELWRAGGWNPQKIGSWRLVPSVTGDERDGLLYACAPKNGPMLAISDGGAGDVTSTRIAWQSNPRATGITSDVCVPLFYKNQLFVLNGDKKTLFCLDPLTGDKAWSVDLGGSSVFRASPTGADGKIYCMNESGDVWVVAADNLHQVLSQTSLGGNPSRGTIAVVDGAAVIRAGEKLYAFKK
jgi:outer membrane protein assembly factor BamB